MSLLLVIKSSFSEWDGRHQARAWLAAEGERAVAYSLLRLNRWARGRGHYFSGQLAYQYKSLLIEHWYTTGRCTHISLQKQVMECHRCGGGGIDPWHGGKCDRCWGSGIYQTNVLYRFVFNLGGRAYCWHQPAGLVGYLNLHRDVDAAALPAFDSLGQTWDKMTLEQTFVLLNVLCYYLRSVGHHVEPPAYHQTLLSLLHSEWEGVRWWWKSKRQTWRRRVENIRRLLEFIETGRFEAKVVAPAEEEDDIPF